MKRPALSAFLVLVTAGAALAAPPEIPEQVPYSAVIPGGGTGPVDLTIRDGDVNDAGERAELAATASVCDVERTAGGGLQVVHGGTGVRLRDANHDGDFTDAGESLTLLSPPTSVDAVEIGADTLTATETSIVVAP